MYPQRSKISKPRVPFFPSPSPELLTRDPAGINEESPLRISVGSGGEGGGVSRFVGWRGLWIPNPAYIRFASNCMQFDATNGAEKGRREKGGRAVKLLSGLESGRYRESTSPRQRVSQKAVFVTGTCPIAASDYEALASRDSLPFVFFVFASLWGWDVNQFVWLVIGQLSLKGVIGIFFSKKEKINWRKL